MKRFLVFLMTAMLFAIPVAAEEFGTRVSNLPPSQDHRVRIDSSLAVDDFSAPIAACPTMVITYEQATQAQVRVYATNRDDDTVAEIEAATVLATLTTDSSTQVEVYPATPYVRVVVDQVETTGTSEVRIICSNIAGTTNKNTIDVDGDGLYEYVRFPQDFDGDGTTWQTCVCGDGSVTEPAYDANWICGTFRTDDFNHVQVDYSANDSASNPKECRFHGQRVWDDATDDLNALFTKTTVGTEIELEAGTYAMKGGDIPTSDSGVHNPSSCWDSGAGSYTDTCPVDGEGTTLIENAFVPHSGMWVHGQGIDEDGDRDLEYTGTMLVSSNGPRTFWNTDTVVNGSLYIGRKNVTYAAQQVLVDSTFTTLAPSVLCLEDDFVDKTGSYTEDGLSDGDLIEITISHETGFIRRVFAYVEDTTTTDCDSGAGHEVIVSGAAPLTQHYMRDFTEVGLSPPTTTFATEYQTWLGEDIDASLNNGVAVVRQDRLTNNIRISDMWFTHLNRIGAGGCEINEIDAAECDNGILIDGYTGWNHLTERIGIIQSSAAFGSGPAINPLSTGEGHVFQNLLARFNQGTVMDIPQYGILRDSTFSDNELINNKPWNAETSAGFLHLIRMQADNYLIRNNKFLRNSAPAGDLDDADMWEHYANVRMFSAVVELAGEWGTFRENLFQMNQMGCVLVQNGGRRLYIEGNTFTCGSYNHHEWFLGNQYNASFPLAIRSKGATSPTQTSGDIFIRNNIFNGWGGAMWQGNQGEIDILGIIPRAQVVLSGQDFNQDLASNVDGDLYGSIVFEGNRFHAEDDLWSHAVIMHTQRGVAETNDENGDQDAERVFFNGNWIEQGNLFGMVTIGGGGVANITGAVNGVDGDFDPDHNNDTVGLAQCGWNYDGGTGGAHGTVVLDFSNRQVDGENGTTTINAANVGDLSATQVNQQCESWLD